MRASDRVSLPITLEKAAPIGRKELGTRSALSTLSLPFFRIIWSAWPGVKKFSEL